jgi:hypothetical protein
MLQKLTNCFFYVHYSHNNLETDNVIDPIKTIVRSYSSRVSLTTPRQLRISFLKATLI